MLPSMPVSSLYYYIKPLIPRLLQIQLRRMIVLHKRKCCENIWPIDEKSAKLPTAWHGWPGGKRFALVLTHDVETSRGHSRCRDLAEMEKSLGFRSSFNFVPLRYDVSTDLRKYLNQNGFEVGVHGLFHDGKYFRSRDMFRSRAFRINQYLKEWESVGFRSPSMLRNLDWFHDLNIEYDASTFDTDPFEPQSDGVGTIFPFWVHGDGGGYVELPYTLPQDFTLYVLMREPGLDIWKQKLEWIAERGGMALVITHPDYMKFNGEKPEQGEYPAENYERFLRHVRQRYDGNYWHPLPKELARFWAKEYASDVRRKVGQHR